MIEHKPLRDRPKILSADVADALDKLIGQEPRTLPVAFDKEQIIDKLVDIAHTDDDGIIQEPTAIAKRSMAEAFRNRMTNTAVFQSGYKRYEEASRLPVVPVTDFFFRVVYSSGDVADVLEGMTDMEVRQSLPKRRAKVMDKDGTGYIRGDEGEVLVFGELAGVVIFPAGSNSALLRAWLKRMANGSGGVLKKAVERIEYARPTSESVAHLKEAAAPISGAMRRALPRPRREES